MIRRASPADLDGLVRLAREAHAGSPYADLEQDEMAFRQGVVRLLMNKRSIVLVAERNGELTGFLLGMAETFFGTKGKYATDLMLFARLGGAGLIKAFHRWALGEMRVDKVIMSVSYGNAARTDRLYESLGMTRTGGAYIRSKP